MSGAELSRRDFIVSSTAFALIPLAIAAKARNSYSAEPHIHIFPDMDFQPKFKADTSNDIFPDQRSNRGQIAGTIARGSLHADDTFYRGIEGGQWTTEILPNAVRSHRLGVPGAGEIERVVVNAVGRTGNLSAPAVARPARAAAAVVERP